MSGDGELEVFVSLRNQRRSYLVLAAFLVFYIVGWAIGFLSAWLGAFGTGVFVGVIAFSLLSCRRGRLKGPVLRLDHQGIEVSSGVKVPWGDIAEVRVSSMRPAWLFWVARVGPWRRSLTVVAFIGADGVAMPAVPVGQPRGRWSRTMARRWYGSECVLAPNSTTVSREELVAAAHDWGGVPVTGLT